MDSDQMRSEQESDECDASPQGPFALLTYNGIPLMLPIPNSKDSLEATARKLHNLASAVSNGSSLSFSKDTVANRQRIDAEAFAKERMSSTELKLYEEWTQKRLTVPSINWVDNRFPVEPSSAKTLSQHAKAMDFIWDHDGAVPENVMWLGNRIPSFMPLVKAVTKLITAKSHLDENHSFSNLSDSEVLELQTLRAITAAAEENLARERERIRLLSNHIRESQEIMRERVRSLRQ